MNAPAVPLKVLARLWWQLAQRRWKRESSLAVIAVVFCAFLIFLGRVAKPAGAFGISLTIALALGNAMALCLSVGGLSIATARRLRLIPLPAHTAFRARLLFGSPLRLPLFAASSVWAVTQLTALSLPPLRFAVESIQVGLMTVVALLLSVLLEEQHGTRTRAFFRMLFLTLNGALTIVLASGWWRPLLPRLPAIPVEYRAFVQATLVGGNEAWPWEFGIIALGVLLVMLLLRTGEHLERNATLTPKAGRTDAPFASRVASQLPIRLRKEVLILVRMLRLRREIVSCLALAILAFTVGVPWLLLAIPFIWLGFLANALGADLPMNGLHRYYLTGYSTHRALRWRHSAVLLTTAACLATAAMLVWLVHGIPIPVVAQASRWQYLGMSLFSLSILLLTATVMDMIALRYPLPLLRRAQLRSAQETGPAMLLIWIVVAMAFVGVVAVAASALGVLATRLVAPADASALALPVAALLLATGTTAVTYFAVRTRG